MNEYFCNIGKKMSEKIVAPRNENLQKPHMNDKSMYLSLLILLQD